MKSMRVWYSVLVVSALCLVLMGCGGGSGSSSAAGSASSSSSSASSPAASSVSTASSSASNSTSSSAASSKTADSAQNIPGRWDVAEVTKDGETIAVADLPEDRKVLAAQQYWVFNADGTFEQVDEGQNFRQTNEWKLDGSIMTISYQGTPLMTATYDGKNIVLESDGITVKFQKSS